MASCGVDAASGFSGAVLCAAFRHASSEWHQGLYPYSEDEYIDLVESIVPCDLHRLLDTPVAPEKAGSQFSLFDAQKSQHHLAKAMLNLIGEEGDGR